MTSLDAPTPATRVADDLPVLGADPALPGLIHATGHYRNGILLAPSTAAAVASTLALIFAPSMFGALLPEWWQRNVISLLPGPAADSLSLGHVQDSPQYLAPLPAAVVVVAWLIGALVLAGRILDRRDA